MKLQDDDALLALKPLYGIPESGLHWFLSFQNHDVGNVNMKPTKLDPFILSCRNGTKLKGVTEIQVEDSFGHGNEKFLDEEEKKTNDHFKTNPRHTMKTREKITFNGTTVYFAQEKHLHFCNQKNFKSFQRLQIWNYLKALFKRTPAKIKHVGIMARPDLCAEIQLLALDKNESTSSEMNLLNKTIKYCNDTTTNGLNFVDINMKSASLLLFTDASFANAANIK